MSAPPDLLHAVVVESPIDPTEVLDRVGGDADGAVLLFLGTVRDHNEGRPVRGVRYEAYEEMARSVLSDIVREARSRLGEGRIVAVHRVGELAIGDVSVAIAVSSPHRAQAYDASRYVIEEIKKRLPVWKQERYAAGESRWLPGVTPEVAADREETAGAREGGGEGA